MARNLARSSSGTRSVLGQGEDAGVEVEPRELPVQEALGRVGERRVPVHGVRRMRGSDVQPGHRTMLLPNLGRRRGPIGAGGAGYRPGRDMSTDPRFAEPTPFARLVYAQAAGACGDACILVSMAGSIFFSSPTSAARGKVLLFLLITMTPFMIIAPVLGPALDRMKGGRRLFLISSAAGRALLCLALAMYISKPAPEGLLVYPLAFGVLVLQKGSTIAKSALVPGPGERRRRARHRQLAPRAHQRDRRVRRRGARVRRSYKLFGADWSLRFGAVVFVDRDDPRDPDPADATARARRRARAAAGTGGDAHAEHPARFERDGRAAGERRLPGVLRRVLAQGRSRSRWASPASPPTSATSAVCSSRPRCAARCGKR